MSGWSVSDIPPYNEKIVIITGANSGLGFESAKALAGKGATIIMACRSEKRTKHAMQEIYQEVADASLSFIPLDLGNRLSIQQFVEQFSANYDRLDNLLNNAGLMAIPERRTDTGFEMQIGVNHFGHFLLTGMLLDKLLKAKNSRITTVSSIYHTRIDRIYFDNINLEDEYNPWTAYSQSKLANVLFGLELNRRLNGKDVVSNLAHPGYAATNLQFKGPDMSGNRIRYFMMQIGNFLLAQSAAQGALPQLYASSASEAEGGKYYGPTGFMHMRGSPGLNEISQTGRDETLAKKLWEFSEEQVNFSYRF